MAIDESIELARLLVRAAPGCGVPVSSDVARRSRRRARGTSRRAPCERSLRRWAHQTAAAVSSCCRQCGAAGHTAHPLSYCFHHSPQPHPSTPGSTTTCPVVRAAAQPARHAAAVADARGPARRPTATASRDAAARGRGLARARAASVSIEARPSGPPSAPPPPPTPPPRRRPRPSAPPGCAAVSSSSSSSSSTSSPARAHSARRCRAGWRTCGTAEGGQAR